MADRPRRYIHSMCRPYAEKATTTPAATAAIRGTSAVSSSRAAPTPARMLVTAAIMLAPVKNISLTLADGGATRIGGRWPAARRPAMPATGRRPHSELHEAAEELTASQPGPSRLANQAPAKDSTRR